MVSVGLQSSKVYQARLLEGTEPPLSHAGERFIRLAGRDSDTTNLSIERYRHNMLPVYEDPSLIQVGWQKERQPLYFSSANCQYLTSIPPHSTS